MWTMNQNSRSHPTLPFPYLFVKKNIFTAALKAFVKILFELFIKITIISPSLLSTCIVLNSIPIPIPIVFYSNSITTFIESCLVTSKQYNKNIQKCQ